MSISSCRILALSSGKGGVGKTSITINTGLALTQKGYRVCVFDADTNLANINIMLRQTPEYTLEHVINGKKSVTEIMLQKEGLYVVPGASGLSDFVNFNKQQKDSLLQALNTCREVFDFILIDSAAGISDSVLSFMQIAQQNVLVITPEPTSLTDAFSLLKVFVKRKPVSHVSVIVNQVVHEQQAKSIYNRFSKAVEKYIGLSVDYIGGIVRDDYFSSSICLQNPVILQNPNGDVSQNFQEIADIISHRQVNLSASEAIRHFVNVNEQAAPGFSPTQKEQAVLSRQNLLKARLIKKIKQTEIKDEQLQLMINMLTPESRSAEPEKMHNEDDKEAILCSIQYAQMAADV